MEKDKKFRSLEVRRKLIALKNTYNVEPTRTVSMTFEGSNFRKYRPKDQGMAPKEYVNTT